MTSTECAGPAKPDQSDKRRRGERGSATIVMLGVIAVILTATVSGLLLASAVLASHQARLAADLAALAAASTLMQGGPPGPACESAARIAAVNHARMLQCAAVGTEVRLSTEVPTGIAGLGVATARSRAGPGVQASTKRVTDGLTG